MEELPVYIPRPRVCHMTQYHCCKRHTACPLYPRCSQIKFQNTVCCQDCPSCTYEGCSLSPQQRQEQPVYIDHVIQQERLDLNLKTRRWQEQQAHRKRHQKLYEYYNNLFGDRLERVRKAKHDRYWADPDYSRAKHREAYEKRRPKGRDGQLSVDRKLISLDLLPDCGLDCFNCPFEDCILPEDWLDQKRKDKTIKRMRLYYQEHRAEIVAQHRAYYLEHREEMSAQHRNYYLKHREEMIARQRAYYLEHLEERKAYIQRYNQEHREDIRERKRLYNRQHQEEIRAVKRKWKQEHPDKVREYNQRYRAKKKLKQQEKEETT